MKRVVVAVVPGIVVMTLLGPSCPAWADDPTMADCLSASEGSIALRREHKLRAARAQLLVCSAASCPTEIRNECIRRVADINAAVPTIVFDAKDASGNDLSAVRVTMDGQPLVDRLEGTAISLDPGEHSFTFETPGQAAVQKQLVIREAEKERRERVAFGMAAQPQPDAAKASLPPTTSGPPAPAREEPPRPAADKTFAYVTLGAGAVGVGVGTVFGLLALDGQSKLNKACTNKLCPSASQSDIDAMHTDAIVSTVGFGVGIVGLALGGYLLLSSPSASSPTKTAGIEVTPWMGPTSLGLAGRFQ